MVERREDLANAIALNSSMFNAAKLIGPAIAGLLIRLLGEWPCFLINGLSYIAVLWSLAAMRVRPVAMPNHEQGMLKGMKEGFGYVWASPAIRSVLGLLGFVNLMSITPHYTSRTCFAADEPMGSLGTYRTGLAANSEMAKFVKVNGGKERCLDTRQLPAMLRG